MNITTKRHMLYPLKSVAVTMKRKLKNRKANGQDGTSTILRSLLAETTMSSQIMPYFLKLQQIRENELERIRERSSVRCNAERGKEISRW